jgi:uncharacterized C2H2 Zn-finger protein
MDLFRRKDGDATKKVLNCQNCTMIFDEKERMKRHEKKAHSEKSGGDTPNMNPFGF